MTRPCQSCTRTLNVKAGSRRRFCDSRCKGNFDRQRARDLADASPLRSDHSRRAAAAAGAR